MVFFAHNGHNQETVLYFAHSTGDIIYSEKLSPTHSETLVKATYSQYVIAANLKPIMDARKFMDAVRSRKAYYQPEEA